MKRNVKRLLSGIFVVVLTVFLVVMELSLRIAGHFSQTANNFIKGLLESHPITFGSLWVILMVSAVCLAFIRMYQPTRFQFRFGNIGGELSVENTGLISQLSDKP